jgi:hypothetical protein
MYVVEILDELGDPAEFVVRTPVVALDLALRARRAGLRFLVAEEDSGRPVPLEDIHHRARLLAAADAQAAEQLRQAEREHDQGRRARLN